MSFDSLWKSIYRTVNADAYRDFARKTRIALNQVKEDILAKVENHEVSQELRNHTRPSQFLNTNKGTLFGFMGFPAGSDPVGELINILRNEIKVRVPTGSLANRIRQAKAELILPNKKDLRGTGQLITRDNWASGKTWMEMLEEGVMGGAGLEYYLGVQAGESGEGIQKKNGQVRDSGFDGVEYLSKIFAEARKEIKNIYIS